MKELKLVKDQVKKYFRDIILEQKLKISDVSKLGDEEETHKYVENVLARFLRKHRISLKDEEFNSLRNEIITDLVGYGIIERLLKDPEITDIIVNGPEQIFIEKKGKLERVDLKFRDKDELIQVIERMIRESGRRIDMSSPYVDFRLERGERVTVVIPPISSASPVFCVRKLLKDVFSIEDLKRFGTINQKLLNFFDYCIKSRLNLLVSGSTGVGKTTLINLLLRNFVPKDERMVIIEDTEELIVEEPQHFIRLVTRSPNIEGKGEITLRDLVKLSLHLRPDRVIIGEVRGEETFHFLHAINTGHEGSMCTIHANNTEDALSRLETLALIDRPNINSSVIRRFLKSGIDLIIHMVRLPSGKRIVSQVSEFDLQKDNWLIKDIFALQRSIRDNKEVYEIKMTGHIPSFIDRLKVRTDIPADFFHEKS